jgi:septal ring factor EnvC (AmiA/AmiB activator)
MDTKNESKVYLVVICALVIVLAVVGCLYLGCIDEPTESFKKRIEELQNEVELYQGKIDSLEQSTTVHLEKIDSLRTALVNNQTQVKNEIIYIDKTTEEFKSATARERDSIIRAFIQSNQ